MKVINRIMLSSALLVVLSLISLLTVFGVVLFLDSMNGDGGKEMLDAKLFRAEEQMNRFDASVEQWERLQDQLAGYGYQLLVMQENNVIYNTLADFGEDRINGLINIKLGNDVVAGQMQDATFIAMNKEGYSIYAVKQAADKSGSNFYAILKPAILICIGVIVVIVLLSQLFTRRMAYRILRPLNALSEGARRVENGDLSHPIIYKGNDEFASVCTAFNHMQEHLLEERRKNNAYEQARIDLVAGISHDLRTPLTSIKGYIKGLRDGVAQTTEKREQYLKIAYQKSTEMDKLLQKLFYFSSLETGILPLALKLRDLGQFAQHYEAAVHEELAQKNAALTVRIESAPHPVRLDSEQMNRVMANLTENAIKYAGVSPLHLNVSVWREGDFEHLLFTDNGQGVPEEHLLHLFEQFWRGDQARTQTDGNSSGLGLYIVNYIVERHGGTVTARSHHGLQIEIVLPGGMEASDE